MSPVSVTFAARILFCFWANRKVQLGGVANCFDFCAICYLHLNLQIFCGQERARPPIVFVCAALRSPEGLHFVSGTFIFGSAPVFV